MAGESLDLACTDDIPQCDGTVRTARREELFVGAERQRRYAALGLGHRLPGTSGRRLPDLDGTARASACEPAAGTAHRERDGRVDGAFEHAVTLPARRVPHPYPAINASACDQPASRRSRQCQDTAGASQRAPGLARRRAPRPEGAVEGTCDDGSPGFDERHGADPRSRACESREKRLPANGPHANRSVFASRGEVQTVGAESDGVHVVTVPLERPHRAPRRDVPEDDGVVCSSRREQGTVRAERDGVDPPRMPVQRRELDARRAVPELHRCVTAGRGDDATGGIECDGRHRPGVTFELANLVARRRVEQADQIIAAGGRQKPSVRGEGERVRSRAGNVDRTQLESRLDTPQHDPAVAFRRARRENEPVRRDCQSGDGVGVAGLECESRPVRRGSTSRARPDATRDRRRRGGHRHRKREEDG